MTNDEMKDDMEYLVSRCKAARNNGYENVSVDVDPLEKVLRSDLAPTSQWRNISVDEPPEGIPVLLAYKNSVKKYVANNAHIPDWCFEARPYCILGSGGAKSWHREATHWMPLPDAPPTKDLADAGKEKV